MPLFSQLSYLYRAIAIILFGILAFDLMGVLVRILSAEFSIYQISTMRNLFGIIPALLFVLLSRSFRDLSSLMTPRLILLTIFRALSVNLAQICYYTALSYIAFATATTLAFTGPLFITALSVPLLGHKVGFWRWSAVLIGFLGVMLIMQPGGDAFTIYALLPVLAAMGYALSSITVRLFPEDVSSSAIQFVTQIFTMIFSVILLYAFSTPLPINTASNWAMFLSVGVCGGVGVLCLVSSYRLADPGQLAPFEYFGIPISFVLGYIFFTEAPFDQLIPGVFIIIGAGMIIVWRERKLQSSDIA
jgi:drug/metabolite transporter (DMT)-like permease